MLTKTGRTLACLLLFPAIVEAAVNIQWTAFRGINDEHGALLQPGSVVQLLSAGPNGLADPLTTARPGLAGGDDIILDTVAIGDGVGGLPGFFIAGPTRFDQARPTDVLFIRAFNAPDLGPGYLKLGTALYYGQGGFRSAFSDPDATPRPDAVIWGVDQQPQTTLLFLIPEPATPLLLLVAAVMLRRRVRG